MAKRRSTASLQKAVDFCPDSGDNDLDSFRRCHSGEEDVLDKEMLQESQ